MTDEPRGAIYPGRKGSEIVGPAVDAATLAEAFNDLELHVTFRGEGDAAKLYSRRMMSLVGVDFPVLLLPASAKAGWYADPTGVAHVLPYDGELPADRLQGTHRTAFGIVRPGDRP